MNLKNVITVTLLVFVGASILILVARGFRQPPSQNGREPTNQVGAEVRPAPLRDGVVAYYFHGNTRCPTCQKIEAYAYEAMTTGFSEQLGAGSLRWRLLNYEEPANQALVEKYEVLAPVVVLSRVQGGKEMDSCSLDRVWQLTDDKGAFIAYIQEEVRSRLQ